MHDPTFIVLVLNLHLTKGVKMHFSGSAGGMDGLTLKKQPEMFGNSLD